MYREMEVEDCGGVRLIPILDENGVFQVTDETLREELFEDVAFFMFAERGAMGEAGCITWLTADESKYHGNYCLGDFNLESIDELFPVFGQSKFGMPANGRRTPRGWEYVNLGMGNHLLVNEKHYEAFLEKTKDCMFPADYYQRWQQVAEEILRRENT